MEQEQDSTSQSSATLRSTSKLSTIGSVLMKRVARSAIGRLCCLVACSAPNAVMFAQDTGTSAASSASVSNLLKGDGPKSQSTLGVPAGALFKFGPIALHTSLSSSYAFSQGLPVEGGKRVTSEVFTETAGLLVALGDRWSLNYTPSWTGYSAASLKDNLSHAIRLTGSLTVSEWGLQFSESYGFSNQILAETAQQTQQRTWAGNIGAGRAFGRGFNFSTSLGLNESYSESSPDVRDWSTMNWLTFHPFHRLVAGFGLGGGYSDIVGQPNSINARVMGRLNWIATDKLNLGIDGGVESRHARITGASDIHNPLLSANLSYNPFKVTTVTLSNARTVTNSLFKDQIKQSSLWSLALNQRLLGHLYASCAYTSSRSSFRAILRNVAVTPIAEENQETDPPGLPVSLPGRSDQSNSISVKLATQLFQRVAISTSFQNTKSESSQKGFEFSTKQFGVELSLSY